MAEHPILFNSEMVRAILKGKKTQTRRIIKGLPLHAPYFEVDEGRGWLEDSEDGNFYAIERFSRVQPGDVLYVRETWCNVNSKEYPSYFYKADNNRPSDFALTPWRPSIHMPKEAARLFLRVTAVRAERLKDITEAEAIAEGFTEDPLEDGKTNVSFMCSVDCLQGTARGKFALLWNKTVRREDADKYGWDANPWVWVIEFRRGAGRREISGE